MKERLQQLLREMLRQRAGAFFSPILFFSPAPVCRLNTEADVPDFTHKPPPVTFPYMNVT